MRYLLLALLLNALSITASESSRKEYLELIGFYPSLVQPYGQASQGEIEIVLDRDKMAAIEAATGRDVGVIARDRYWIWINDACIFPNGREGVYGRILCTQGLMSSPGVAVMAMTLDHKIVLNCNFRHATRSWEIELPRGGINPGESLEAAAKREVVEETGMVIEELSLLGMMPPDSGLTSTIAPVFIAQVTQTVVAEPEDSEAIEEILTLSIEEIKQAFLQGYYTCTIKGAEQRVNVRDPFLAYALLMYEVSSKK